jgi:hypothetical protein
MTPPAQEPTVQVRIVLDDRGTLAREKASVSEDELFRIEKELSTRGVLPPDDRISTGLGAGSTYRGLLEMFGMFGDIIGRSDHTIQTVKVFIETAIAGPALTALISSIVKVLVDDFKKKLADGKSKDAKITLYGPDGKEIDLNSKH